MTRVDQSRFGVISSSSARIPEEVHIFKGGQIDVKVGILVWKRACLVVVNVAPFRVHLLRVRVSNLRVVAATVKVLIGLVVIGHAPLADPPLDHTVHLRPVGILTPSALFHCRPAPWAPITTMLCGQRNTPIFSCRESYSSWTTRKQPPPHQYQYHHQHHHHHQQQQINNKKAGGVRGEREIKVQQSEPRRWGVLTATLLSGSVFHATSHHDD